MTKNRTLVDLLLCSASFLATVIVCVALRPSDIFSHDGLSYYGNFEHTIIPYGIGLVATAYFLLRACYTLKDTLAAHSFRVALEAIAIGLLGIVATPSFTHNLAVQDTHVVFGFVIFITQALVSLHYIGRDDPHFIDWMLLASQITAIALVALSFRTIAVLDVMLPAQILATVSFGTILIRAVNRHSGEVARLTHSSV
jgi:hypothetical protein